MNISTKSHEETLAFGVRLGKCLQAGDIVLMFGDLGAGKTTLTQGICQGLGVKEKYIRSPTFTLINEYIGIHPVYHIDLYRLDSFSEIEALGLEESIFSNGISIIEWAEKLLLQTNKTLGLGINERIEIHITSGKENHRTFNVMLLSQRQRSLSL